MQLRQYLCCMLLTTLVSVFAFMEKKQFYPAVVYITKSNAFMAVFYIQFFANVFMFGKLLCTIFLGTLRDTEFDMLLERFWYALTETCLAFTVFREDFNPRFVALFTVLLFLKSFHWLAEERIDIMERSPLVALNFHIRIATLLLSLGSLDYSLLMHAYNSTVEYGPTVQLVFGFEYAILLTVIANITIKYILYAAEIRTDTPWENKAIFMLYTGLFIGLIRVILYVLFVLIMTKFYALPMFVFRPMFFTIRNFKKAITDVIMCRRAIRNMNNLYPDATPEELSTSDNICIICREDMVSHSKKLPCGHIFHTTCLRSWFQRQQTCPTCRLNILRAPAINAATLRRPNDNPANAAATAAAAAAAATAAAAAGGVGGAASTSASNETGNAQTTNVNGNTGNLSGNNTDNLNSNTPMNLFEQFMSNNASSGSTQTIPMMPTPPPPPPFMMPPPFPFLAPYALSPPPMPPDLTQLSDDELKALEGNQRKNIEERIKLLRNIQVMLDAAVVLMNNYQIVMARSQTTETNGNNGNQNSNENSQSGPSTSSAAAGEVSRTVENKDSTSTTAAADSKKAAAASASLEASNSTTGTKPKLPVAKHNQVTIEDLGGEESESKSMSSLAGSTTPAMTLNDESIDPINELRKRRLQFLEEQNKTLTNTE